MKVLVTGGCKCGKSTFAEKYIMEMSKGRDLFYFATMKVIGEEGMAVVERHRTMRAGKGFTTIEQERDITKAPRFEGEEDATVMLECLTTLVANEMFEPVVMPSEDEIIAKLKSDLEEFASRYKNLLVITNNVFEDGAEYDESTRSYIRVMAALNNYLTARFDKTFEIVAGIPLEL